MASEAVTVRGGEQPRARTTGPDGSWSHDGHVIVCGLHGVGLRTVELLHRSRVPVVGVDDDPDPRRGALNPQGEQSFGRLHLAEHHKLRSPLSD